MIYIAGLAILVGAGYSIFGAIVSGYLRAQLTSYDDGGLIFLGTVGWPITVLIILIYLISNKSKEFFSN